MAKHEKAKIDDRKRQLRLLQNPKLSNVQFVLDNDGAAVSANNGILSLKCEYFDAMFRGECTKVARNRLLLILSLSPCLMWSDRRLWQCWNGCTAKQPTAENCLGVLALRIAMAAASSLRRLCRVALRFVDQANTLQIVGVSGTPALFLRGRYTRRASLPVNCMLPHDDDKPSSRKCLAECQDSPEAQSGAAV